jgi:hypothetical protein
MVDPLPLRCGFYWGGHEPHWIPVLKGAHDTANPPVPGRLLEVHADGRVDAEFDGAVWRLWNHEPARLEVLAARNDVAVSLQWRWRVLRTRSREGNYAFNVCRAGDQRPCPIRGGRRIPRRSSLDP